MNTETIPQLRKAGPVTQLYVDDRPFLVLGGELGNSTASDLDVLRTAFEKLRRMNLNTVMLPVYWHLVEPEEGKYDFSLVQGAIELAREYDLRLVYLWFGTWKNSMSCYAPGWVKRDTTRFERVRTSSGETMEIISPQCEAAAEADSRAFAAMMRWTKQFDGEQHTVIMVQVENEIGMIPEPRDHSAKSQAAYQSEVPDELMSRLTKGELGPEVAAAWEKAGRRSKGSWAEVFGSDVHGQEIFSAWQFSTYVETVTAAGKREYPLPMFVNAALIRPGYVPGQYPSAGPLPQVLEVWQTGAPSVDMLCPDIYFPNFAEWSRRYMRSGNPLFVPELAPSTRASGNALYAAAALGAIGVGPFSIEYMSDEKDRLITSCYRLLAGMSSMVLEAQQKGNMIGLSPQPEFDWAVTEGPQRGELGGVIFEARFDRPAGGGSFDISTLPTHGPGRWEAPPGTPLGAAMILQIGPEEFVIMGMGVTVTFHPADGKGKVGIDEVREGRYEGDGEWVGGRWLSGDQTHQGRHVQLYGGEWRIQRVKLYRYE